MFNSGKQRFGKLLVGGCRTVLRSGTRKGCTCTKDIIGMHFTFVFLFPLYHHHHHPSILLLLEKKSKTESTIASVNNWACLFLGLSVFYPQHCLRREIREGEGWEGWSGRGPERREIFVRIVHLCCVTCPAMRFHHPSASRHHLTTPRRVYLWWWPVAWRWLMTSAWFILGVRKQFGCSTAFPVASVFYFILCVPYIPMASDLHNMPACKQLGWPWPRAGCRSLNSDRWTDLVWCNGSEQEFSALCVHCALCRS